MATLPTPPGDLPPEQFFLENLKDIEEIISHCCRRSRFSREETEDFGGHVKCRLIENDYAVLREFRSRSKPRTFLTVVISNLHKDYRNHIWGKRRPSAEALRLGPVAVRLEELHKDGLSFDEACQYLRINEKVEMSDQELADLQAKLPHRIPRRVVGEEHLQAEPARDPPPDEQLEKKEREGLGRRVFTGLQRALDVLSPEEKLLIMMKMRFSVADIARHLGVEQKPLYRRLDKIYKKLRKELERQGVRRQDVEEILGRLRKE
ncbi:MAG TPA: sigma-70 family RNA polymerase sigma factor [Thermoanaerobaculia bacterium]|jgi:RNA polymerase sigma factor (sigma-70 family)